MRQIRPSGTLLPSPISAYWTWLPSTEASGEMPAPNAAGRVTVAMPERSPEMPKP